MGKDNQPKHRQKARDLHRRSAVRHVYERVLIVCEGEKTEPQYLGEICRELRLSTTHVHVQQGKFGTEPLQVTNYAEHLFRKGDRTKGIEAKSFDRIFVVFDRDQHHTYHAALSRVAELDGQLINDEKKKVNVQAIASVPCFEIWLLLHFEEVHAPLHRADVYDRLMVHMPSYDKGQAGNWDSTKSMLDGALQRALARSELTDAHDGVEPYTDIGRLVQHLLDLKRGGLAS